MKRYLEKVKSLSSTFDNFSIQKISRASNTKANLLSKLATLALNELSKEVLFEVLQRLS